MNEKRVRRVKFFFPYWALHEPSALGTPFPEQAFEKSVPFVPLALGDEAYVRYTMGTRSPSRGTVNRTNIFYTQQGGSSTPLLRAERQRTSAPISIHSAQNNMPAKGLGTRPLKGSQMASFSRVSVILVFGAVGPRLQQGGDMNWGV